MFHRSTSTSATLKSKKRGDIKDVITNAHSDDLNYLHDGINKYNHGSQNRSMFQFMLQVPAMSHEWNLSTITRLRKWLEALGFVEDFFGNGTVFKLSSIGDLSLSELQRYLSQIHPHLASISNSMVSTAFASSTPAHKQHDRSMFLTVDTSINSACQQFRPASSCSSTTFSSMRPRLENNIRPDDILASLDSPLSLPPTPLPIQDESPVVYTGSVFNFAGTDTGLRNRSSSGSPSTVALIQSMQTQMRFSNSSEGDAGMVETKPLLSEEESMKPGYNSSGRGHDQGVAEGLGAGSRGPDLKKQISCDALSSARESSSSSKSKMTKTHFSSTFPGPSLAERSIPHSINFGTASPPTASRPPPKDAFKSASSYTDCLSPIRPLSSSERLERNTNSNSRCDESLPHSKLRVAEDRAMVRKLKRSISMPVKPSHSMQDQHGTPGGVCKSQNDAVSEYQTPQSIRLIKYSGHKDDDWGMSLPASATCLKFMRDQCLSSEWKHSSKKPGQSSGVKVAAEAARAYKDIPSQTYCMLQSNAQMHYSQSHLVNIPSMQDVQKCIENNSTSKFLSPVVSRSHETSLSSDNKSFEIASSQCVFNSHNDPHSNSPFFKSGTNRVAIEHNTSLSEDALVTEKHERMDVSFNFDDPLGLGFDELHVTLERRKTKNCAAKLRRMSFGARGALMSLDDTRDSTLFDFSTSPAPLTKAKARSSNSGSTHKLLSHGSSMSFDYVDTEVHDFHRNPDALLSERVFSGVLVGCSYQHCFENNCPVVAAPSSSDTRVVDAKVDDARSLHLKLYSPARDSFFFVNLGSSWRYMPACPTGYLLFQDEFKLGNRQVMYFTAKHPYEVINVLAPGNRSRSQSLMDSDLDDFRMGYSSHESLHTVSSTGETCIATRTECNVDWNNSGIIMLVLDFLIGDSLGALSSRTRVKKSKCRRTRNAMSAAEDRLSFRLVSKAWALGSYRLLSRHLSNFDNSQNLAWSNYCAFVAKYSAGFFLSRGACKTVFCVAGATGACEAVSVMDIDDLFERGMEECITQEIEISLLASALTSLNLCPNFVLVHSLFRSDFYVPESLWYQSRQALAVPGERVAPKKAQTKSGYYQYIRMEYCEGGDLEHIVRQCKLLPLDRVKLYLFQMCFALYTSREQLSLRHYDIKLLNFFMSSGRGLFSDKLAAIDRSRPPALSVMVGMGRRLFSLPLSEHSNDLVKLADFGTSVIGSGGLGDPISIQQFTTIENTPPEFLLLGSAARQSFSSDTFGLGLCFLHLLTGHEPYEELLREVRCPPYLKGLLRDIWSTTDRCSPYFLLHELMRSLSSEEVEVLFDTLYRYMVLFGLPADDLLAAGSPVLATPVWGALVHSLSRSNNKSSPSKASLLLGDSFDRREQCLGQYQVDCSRWSVATGAAPVMLGARCRLAQLGDEAAATLRCLTHLDPSRRPALKDVLLSPLFLSLQYTGHDINAPLPVLSQAYTYFLRDSDEKLPIF